MPYQDLRECINDLESVGELTRVAPRVSWDLEITDIADRVVKRNGPALLFEHVADSDMPLLINVLGTEQRMLRALGVRQYAEVTERIEQLIKPDMPATLMAKVKKLPQLLQLAGFAPKTVGSAAVQQVVTKGDLVDLFSMPVLKCWPDDGGRFITLPLVITADPDTGIRNVGMYRLQVYDRCTTGLHIHPHHDGAHHLRSYARRGQRMPVSVVIGCDPVITYAATAPVPPAMDELLFAGFLRNAAVNVARCVTNDLHVVADAEIVLEGYVDPGESRIEGPFGDHTGFYSPADEFPVFHVEAITTRRDPIYQTTVVGIPPMEDTFMGKATERIFLPVLKVLLPEMTDYNLPEFGVFHNCAFVAIHKQYPYHARKVINALWGLGQMMLTKIIVVVDHTVDVQNIDEVMFHVGANVDPRRDVTFSDGPLDILDHAAPFCGAGSKMGIDATAKLPGEGTIRPFPELLKMDQQTAAAVTARWNSLGISLP